MNRKPKMKTKTNKICCALKYILIAIISSHHYIEKFVSDNFVKAAFANIG